MTFLSELESLDVDDAALILERAAIMEFDGNMPREQAERLAMADVLGAGKVEQEWT